MLAAHLRGLVLGCGRASSGGDDELTKGVGMVRRRALLVALAAFATMGIAVANADAPTITGFPNQINKVDLNGYVIQTSYPLGANTGFTFQQTYGTTTVSAHAVPDNGQRFVSNYVAMPVGNKMLMVTWYLDDGTITDVFVMNFQTGVVSDVAPHPNPPTGPGPSSLGTVKVLEKGPSRIPPP
jgi:hypothetical protein